MADTGGGAVGLVGVASAEGWGLMLQEKSLGLQTAQASGLELGIENQFQIRTSSGLEPVPD